MFLSCSACCRVKLDLVASGFDVRWTSGLYNAPVKQKGLSVFVSDVCVSTLLRASNILGFNLRWQAEFAEELVSNEVQSVMPEVDFELANLEA